MIASFFFFKKLFWMNIDNRPFANNVHLITCFHVSQILRYWFNALKNKRPISYITHPSLSHILGNISLRKARFSKALIIQAHYFNVSIISFWKRNVVLLLNKLHLIWRDDLSQVWLKLTQGFCRRCQCNITTSKSSPIRKRQLFPFFQQS